MEATTVNRFSYPHILQTRKEGNTESGIAAILFVEITCMNNNKLNINGKNGKRGNVKDTGGNETQTIIDYREK